MPKGDPTAAALHPSALVLHHRAFLFPRAALPSECCAHFSGSLQQLLQVLMLEQFLPHREIPSKRHCPYCCNGPSLGCPFVRGCVVRSAAPIPSPVSVGSVCSVLIHLQKQKLPTHQTLGQVFPYRSIHVLLLAPLASSQLSKLRRTLQPPPWLLSGSCGAAPPRGGDAFSPHAAGSMATWGEDVGLWVTWGSCSITELRGDMGLWGQMGF